MALALTIVDAEDGSGGTATIAGSSAGTVDLFAAPWTGVMDPLSPPAWTAVGSRTGDGDIAVSSPGTLALGYYLWMVLDAGSFASAFQNLTDAAAHTVMPRVLDAVQLRIRALALPGLNTLQVLQKWIARAVPKVDTFPCIQICPYNAESFPDGLAGKDDIALPVMVAIWWAANQKNEPDPVLLDWRWKILSALRFQRLPGVPEIITCKPSAPRLALAPEPPDAIVDVKKFDKENLILSALVFQFISRTTRG